jgi:hypothetical protein
VGPGDVDGDGYDDLWANLKSSPALTEDEYMTNWDFTDLDGNGRAEAILEVDDLDGNGRLEIHHIDTLLAGDPNAPALVLSARSNWGALKPGDSEDVSHALDYNGDGLHDLPLALRDPGVSILLGATTLDAMAVPGYPTLAYEFDTAGDVDGDGFDDILVLAYDVQGRGRVELFYGNASGAMDSPGATIRTRETLGLGLDIIPAGDLNGDGFDDFVLSQGRFTGRADNEPNAYLHVVYGSAR